MSPKYKQYGTAQIDFSTAQLRKETGSQINDSEIVMINLTYFPLPGDDQGTIALKRENREKAILAMKTDAGAAYDKIMEAIKSPKDDAVKVLIERAKTNPELKNILIEKGIIRE